MIIKCYNCGDEKLYKTKSKRKCPESKNHDWRIKVRETGTRKTRCGNDRAKNKHQREAEW